MNVIKKSLTRVSFLLLILLISTMCAFSAGAAPKLSKKSITMYVGDTKTITLKNTAGPVKWKTSKKSVVSITGSNGTKVTIKGKRSGSAKIKATVGGKTYTCRITVKSLSSLFRGYQWAQKMYLTGDDTTDYMIEVVCQKAIGYPGKSQKDMIRDLFQYLACRSTHYRFSRTNDHEPVGQINFALNSSTTKHKIAAYHNQLKKMVSGQKAVKGNFITGIYSPQSMLEYGYGDCITTAETFQAMLAHIGVISYIAHGSSTTSGHSWNIVLLGGQYYFCDADSGNFWWYTIDSDYTGPFDFSQCMFGTNRLAEIGYTYSSSSPGKSIALYRISPASLPY